jgi:acid stress-induced BolA-like protein IbaG/YrbA
MMDVKGEIQRSIVGALPGARVDVMSGSGGHFEITVVSPVFEGKTMLQKQRLVLGAIKHLMAGDAAPVHAVDRLTTLTEA